ncbi:hypothetical protein MKW98_019011 [Papaver atlanticum]|uniref:PGG domain-containing protein n=1 Tax=Papaver atlanticum TaxID=357466 RepID=A0AAD4TJL4_9MAGN|nr:hypothetical protein MKW98_019011 [Papaver atlanticum]
MESRLYDASRYGDITSLMELIREDPLIFERVINGFGETPLHISAMCGHVDFAAEILRIKPELASEVDPKGLCPLHMASARKSFEMVSVLVDADPNVCVATDQHGRTPLHLAAIKNQVQNMKLLIETKPEAIKILLNRGETILHFCVKHGSFEALMLLVEFVGLNEGWVSVNSMDDDGNTILHLAVSRRQTKMIGHLLNNNLGVDINALNKNGFTALDILITQSLKEFEDKEIEAQLRYAGALSAVEQVRTTTEDDGETILITTVRSSNVGSNVTSEYDTSPMKVKYEGREDWLTDKQNVLIVVVVLIATMAFQAGFSPPGGVWQEDSKLNSSTDPDIFLYYAQKTLSFDYIDSTLLNLLKSSNNTKMNQFGPVPDDGLVLEDEWTSIISNYTGFYPYLIRYAGTSILAYKSPMIFGIYIISNTVGLLASLSIILLLLTGLAFKRKIIVWILMVIMWTTITCVAVSYLIAIFSMIPPFNIGNQIFNWMLGGWLVFVAFIFLLHILWFFSWYFKKLGST